MKNYIKKLLKETFAKKFDPETQAEIDRLLDSYKNLSPEDKDKLQKLSDGMSLADYNKQRIYNSFDDFVKGLDLKTDTSDYLGIRQLRFSEPNGKQKLIVQINLKKSSKYPEGWSTIFITKELYFQISKKFGIDKTMIDNFLKTWIKNKYNINADEIKFMI
jgi:hypothetical protein